MSKGKTSKGKTSKRWELYEIKDGKVIRKNRICPKCGDGVFLAKHGDRLSCGKCGYTESKKK
ncbi:MAG: 30S ribosomal protein S27ae [Candidatus Altiarchaeales archaeon WOR_SM1_79]|nr:MAG: 30S ribosomal protein S27ae [Candidatus Altiarchaeales archaeon WOR_SM1_79]